MIQDVYDALATAREAVRIADLGLLVEALDETEKELGEVLKQHRKLEALVLSFIERAEELA